MTKSIATPIQPASTPTTPATEKFSDRKFEVLFNGGPLAPQYQGAGSATNFWMGLSGDYCLSLGDNTCLNLGVGSAGLPITDEVGDPQGYYRDTPEHVWVEDSGQYIKDKFFSPYARAGISHAFAPFFFVRPSLFAGYHDYQYHYEQAVLQNGKRVVTDSKDMASEGLMLGAGLGAFVTTPGFVAGISANGLMLVGDQVRYLYAPLTFSVGARF